MRHGATSFDKHVRSNVSESYRTRQDENKLASWVNVTNYVVRHVLTSSFCLTQNQISQEKNIALTDDRWSYARPNQKPGSH